MSRYTKKLEFILQKIKEIKEAKKPHEKTRAKTDIALSLKESTFARSLRTMGLNDLIVWLVWKDEPNLELAEQILVSYRAMLRDKLVIR